MGNKIKEYLNTINEVSHTTLNPNGPGVVRIHLIPPKKIKMNTAWIVILNGQDILPLNTSWAILLKEFIQEVNKTSGKSVSSEDIKNMVNNTIERVQKVFTQTKKTMIRDDLNDIVSTLVDIAKGKTPPLEIGFMSLAKYAKFMNAPHRMDLMISSMSKDNKWNCNQKCIHCYAGCQNLANVNELSTEDWKSIIEKCKKAYIPQLTFTGGEPTLRNDLVELIEYSKWFVTRLNTNGILLKEELCKELYDASLDSVQVTLYSNNEEIHNLLVGSSHFEQTVQGIENAIKAGLNVSINTPLCELNKDYVNTLQFGMDLGVKYFTCSGLIMTGNATNEESLKTYLEKEELLEILKQATSFCKSNELELSFTSPGWIEENELKKLKLTIPSCGACLSNMAIAPNGDVIPCQSWLSSDSLGNLVNDNWKSIWNNKICKEIRKQSSKMEQLCPLAKKSKEVTK